MRKFTRSNEPNILKENQEKWNKQWVELRMRNESAQFSWYTFEGKKANEYILPTLKEQTQSHCSFCDAFPVEGVSTETIEHFRPKSMFPELAYTWTNLYYCCNSCQTSKGDKWDELVLQPDTHEYSLYRYFEYDFTTGEIRPNALGSQPDQDRAAKTIELYDLNSVARQRLRRNELRRFKKQTDQDSETHLWAYRDYLGVK